MRTFSTLLPKNRHLVQYPLEGYKIQENENFIKSRALVCTAKVLIQLRWGSFLIAFVLLAQTGYALDLAEMQKMALQNREVVKRYMVNLEKSEKDILRSRAGYYPSVDLSYKANALDEALLTEAKENSILYGAVTWNLFNGFKDKYQIESAELLKEVESYRLTGLRQDIQLNVALKFLDVYERKANLEVAEKNYNTLAKIYRDGQNRLDVGLIDKNELLKFKVDLDNSDIVLKAAKAGLEKSVHLLGREIGQPIMLGNLDFTDFNAIPPNEDVDRNTAAMLAKRSELLTLKKLAEASGFQEKTEKADYYPKVNIIGSYSKYDDDYINGNGDINEEELRAQLVVSINLFRGGLTEETVARARLENLGLQYDLKELADSFSTELINLHIDYKVSLENIDATQQSIAQAEENLRITQLKYDEGLQRESDLLDAITNLSRAQYNNVAAIRSAFLNHFKIVRMVEGF